MQHVFQTSAACILNVCSMYSRRVQHVFVMCAACIPDECSMYSRRVQHVFHIFCVQYFFTHPNSVDVGGVIHEANLMRNTTPAAIHPEKLLPKFCPLTKDTYPVFSKYPKFIVDYQVQEREQIRLEELEYLRER